MRCFYRVVPPRRIVCENPRKMLGDMYGDLPEDFRNMHDRRKSYNRPLNMKRSKMGIRDVEPKKKKGLDLPGSPAKAGLFSQDQKGQSFQGWGRRP
jgi:hypothetical protein